MLKIDTVSKCFDGVEAVSCVSLSIQPATVAGLIGPNGAGKTTLFNIICGFIRPDKGTILFKGNNLNGYPPHMIAAMGIGRTFQNLRIIRMLTVLDNVMLSCRDPNQQRIFRSVLSALRKDPESKVRNKAYELLDFVGLSNRANDLAGSLSYGQQKLLGLACCLALEPSLLLLDEPVAGVNQEMIMKILSLINDLKESGIGVFFIEHNLAAVMEICDRLIVMDGGRIIADGIPSAVKEDSAVIEAYVR